jgi:hypothetical protein
VNHTTTGHKLQGKTVKLLGIAEWSKVKNWAYVVLSRIKTLGGLFLMKPIPERRHRLFATKQGKIGHDGKFKEHSSSNS